LKRRNVFRVGAAYAVVAWLLVEVASVVLPAFEAPIWMMRALIILAILGFPIALILAWVFELTPEGVKPEKTVDRAESIARKTGRKLDFAIIGLLAVALIFIVVDNYVLEIEPEEAIADAEQVSAARLLEREKSIAVLPFDNISPDPGDAYFADGVHDEVLAQLSKIGELKVISRTSVMGYRREDKPSLPEIAAELGVANILEGSVRLAGNRVRITTQLIEARSDAHLWTETYDREFTAANIFSIQSDVAKAVADALRAALSPGERGLLDAVPTENMAALQAYFRGKRRMEKRSVAALAEAVDDFNRAIERDPSFALAYVGLADCYLLQIAYSNLPLDEMLAKAQAAAEKALALNDQLAEAYTSLGQIERERTNYEAAEVAFKRSLELNPNYATAYHWYSTLLGGPLERRRDALDMIERAAELDPRSPIVLTAVGYSFARLGRFEEELTWYRKSIEIDPDFANGYLWIGNHYWEVEGNLDEAVRQFRKGVSIDPGAVGVAFLGWIFLDLGDLDRAEYWIERSKELAPEYFLTNLTAELLHLYQGDLPAALKYGRRAFETENSWILQFSSFEPVRIREIRAGRYPEARAAFEKLVPELLDEDPPEIGIRTYRAAIDLALILSKMGERERADRLLESSLQYIQRIPRLGNAGYAVCDAQIYALLGDKQKALSALRRAIDEGWRKSWWYYLKIDPTLESLHDEPEFHAMVQEIEADMAAQLERVREMERNGELTPIPEFAPATP
jgi:TolB-like protein/Flp pilus assembly protein TadD